MSLVAVWLLYLEKGYPEPLHKVSGSRCEDEGLLAQGWHSRNGLKHSAQAAYCVGLLHAVHW